MWQETQTRPQACVQQWIHEEKGIGLKFESLERGCKGPEIKW